MLNVLNRRLFILEKKEKKNDEAESWFSVS